MRLQDNAILITGLVFVFMMLPKRIAESTKNISFLGRSDLPRGMRNNNPGNIERVAANNWQGRIPPNQQTDPRFEQFQTYPYGIRAMIIVLRNYINRHGANTIRKIIKRWAPKDGSFGGQVYENPEAAYIDLVARETGISPDAIINPNDKQTMYRLVRAMAYMENGVETAVTRPLFDAGWKIV